MTKRDQARRRLAMLGLEVIDGAAEPQTDRWSASSFNAASPRGEPVRSCSMSLTADGLNPMSAPISESVLPRARRSEMRDAQVVIPGSLRYPVDSMQRHPVTDVRDAHGMPRPADLPRFDTLGARIKYWRETVRKWDRRELCKRAKIPYSTLAGIEDGDQSSSTKLPQIAAALGVNPIYLATDKGDPEITSVPVDDDESWPLPVSRDELLDLDPNELELAGMKFQKVIDEIRAKRPKQRPRKVS